MAPVRISPLFLVASIVMASVPSFGRDAGAQIVLRDANLSIVCLARDSPGGLPIGVVEQDETPLTINNAFEQLSLGGGAGWSCDTSGSLTGPRIALTAEITADLLALESNAFLTYEFVVRDPTGTLPVGSLVPIRLTGLARASFDHSFTEPTGSAGGTIRAFVQGDPFGISQIRAFLDAFVLGDPVGGGSETYSCNGLPTLTGVCQGMETLDASAPIGSVQEIVLGFDFEFDVLDTEVTASGVADPVIEIDPVAEFAPGMRYIDFVEIEISPGVVQQVPEPGRTSGFIAAMLALSLVWYRRYGSRTSRKPLARLDPPLPVVGESTPLLLDS